MRNAMAADYSWNRSAGQYLGLYKRLLGMEKGPGGSPLPENRPTR